MADGTIHVPAKICTKCKIEKPATAEFFYRHKSQRDGLTSRCRVCAKADNDAWHDRNRELARAATREWARKNPERNAAWRKRNPEAVKALGREWRRKNLRRLAASQRRRREVNPGEHAAIMRAYRIRNIDRVRERERAQRLAKKHDARFKIAKAISGGLLKALRGRKNGAQWESLVGYGREELVRHLERQFSRGMSWENFGTAWHVDHIVPVSSFRFASKDDPEVRACWALTNMRPLPKHDNLTKHAKRTHLI
jgi:hypothetical protein